MQLTNEDVKARRCEGSWGLSGCGNLDWTVGKHPCKHGQQGTGGARQSEQVDKNHTCRRCAAQSCHRGPATRMGTRNNVHVAATRHITTTYAKN